MIDLLNTNIIKLKHVSVFILFIVLAPFVTLCFFAHPSFIDDYCFVEKFESLGLANAFFDWYNNWTGRYSLCFLMSLNHFFIGSLFLYRAIIVGMIALVPLLAFLSFKLFFKKQSSGFYISFTALFSFLYFYQLPSINEGLYWMTGAVAYQLPTLCLLVILILLFNICNNRGNKVINSMLSSLLVVILIGTNEISMATITLFLLLIIAYRLKFRIKNNKELFIIFMISVIASFFVIQAPGNNVRGELFPLANDWSQAIQMTILGFGYYIFQWVGISCLVAMVSLYILDKTKMLFSYHSLSIPFAWSSGIFLVVLLGGFFVPAWSTGQMPNPRAINVLFAIFVIGFFYHIFFFYQQFMARGAFEGISKIAVLLTACSIFFITLSSAKGVNNNIKTAYIDILSGKAYRFDCSMVNLYKSKEWIETFHKNALPISLSCETTESTYKGCPEKYIKEHYK